jgi:acyl carrier protein
MEIRRQRLYHSPPSTGGTTAAVWLPNDQKSNRGMTESLPENTQEAELARLIVSTLNLDVSAADIDPEAPLYGEGLGLDSIDMLEIALAVSREFGVKLRADDKNNRTTFSSLRALNRYIRLNQAN